MVPNLGISEEKAPPKRSLDGPPSGYSECDRLGHPPELRDLEPEKRVLLSWILRGH
jgi:hypothetical protein